MMGQGQMREQIRPFRSNTQAIRQLNQQENSKTHALGSTVSYRIDKYGGLSGILFYLFGTVTLSGAGTLANLGPWNVVKRIRLTLNNNAVTVVDIDGYHAYLLGLIMTRTFGADGAGNYTPNAITYATSVAATSTWVLPYFVPCSLNQGSDVLTGMVNMQAQTANLALEVDLESTASNLVSTATAASFTGELHNFTYELRKSTEIPPLVLVTTQQKTDNITAVGLTTHEIIPQGDLLDSLMSVVLNGSRNSADVVNVQWRAGTNKYNLIESPRLNHWKFQRDYSKPAPTGVFIFDDFNANEDPNSGDFMNVVKTNNFTKLETLVSIASGATLGAGNNFFHNVERRIIPLAL